MANLPQQHTRKKIKYVGSQSYINTTTGDIEEFQVTEIEERDFNFSKVWMRNFISTLEMVGNQKTKVAFWIIDNLDKENRLCCTFREMSEELNISYKTCADTMKLLQDADFLRKRRSGLYEVNPDIVFKGSRQARLNALTTYKQIGFEPPELTKEEKIANLKKAMQALQNELIKLESEDLTVDSQLEFLPNGEIIERAK